MRPRRDCRNLMDRREWMESAGWHKLRQKQKRLGGAGFGEPLVESLGFGGCDFVERHSHSHMWL